MKPTFKYLACVSAMTLMLGGMVGCSKKDSPEPQAEAEIEVAKPEVVERPVVVCDDISIKNRVVSLVQDELYHSSVRLLGDGASTELAQQLKARLSALEIDLQNLSEEGGECHAQLHIVLPSEEIAFANKTFSAAGVVSLEDQAVEKDVSLMGGSRLVGNFTFQADGEALSIDAKAPAIALASETMATAVRSMNKQNKANAKRETAQIGKTAPDIIPAPNVQIRPVELPSVPQTTVPSPESAILRPEDVPSGVPQKLEKSDKSAKTEDKVEKKTEKSETKSEPKLESNADKAQKVESKEESKVDKSQAKSEPNNEKPASTEITIVETDETY